MSVIFVGSNPSHAGPYTPAIKNLAKWVSQMRLILGQFEVGFTNVSDQVTENNRPLKKSEYQLHRLKTDVTEFKKVVALGNTASDALTKLNVEHFKLPHPSPRNRKLNDQSFVDKQLYECMEFISC